MRNISPKQTSRRSSNGVIFKKSY
ncbi:unnamed protein product [Amaranthus hypochondriacus]